MHRLLLTAVFIIVAAGPSGAEEFTGTLQKISNSGAIVLGHRDASPPFSFLDDKKQPAGYSVDLCLRIVEAVKTKLGRPDLTVKYVPVSAENRFDKVADGTVDLECGNTTHTLSGREHVDFTLTTFITGAGLLLPAGSGIKSVGELGGKRVAVVQGTTTETGGCATSFRRDSSMPRSSRSRTTMQALRCWKRARLMRRQAISSC